MEEIKTIQEEEKENEQQSNIQIDKEKIKINFCKIHMENGKFGNGFFCKIPFPDELNILPILFTDNHTLDENAIKDGETIQFTLENDNTEKKIEIDSTRKTYTNKNSDITIIEIKNSDEINSFLEIDEELFNSLAEKKEKDDEEKKICVIQYKDDGQKEFSEGTIQSINENNIDYSCSNKIGSSRGLILNLINLKLIGVIKEETDNCSQGILMKILIKEFFENFKNNNQINSDIDLTKEDNKKDTITNFNKANENESESEIKSEETKDNNKEGNINIDENDENEKNRIILKIKIDEDDIDEKINFLGFNEALEYFKGEVNNSFYNDEEKKESWCSIKDIEKQLSKLNEKNIIIYIDDKKEEYPYFIPKTSKIYTISLIFKIELDCCAGMFFRCSNLIDINLSNFNTQNVTNLLGMFWGCNNLIDINLSNFNTRNVTNMRGMFYECNKLSSINLSSFETQNVTNMRGMFYECNNLTDINLSNFDTQSVKYLNSIFCGCNKLTNVDLSNFNTKNVTNMRGMFYDCNNLTIINFLKLDIQNVKDISEITSGCSKLANIIINDEKSKEEFKRYMAKVASNNKNCLIF